MYPTYAEAAAALASTGVAAGDPLTLPLDQARARQDAYFAALNQDLPPLAGGTTDLRIPGPHGEIPLRLHHPKPPSADGTPVPLPVVVFVRGAGWWAGALDSHARTMHTLARLTGCTVCGVDYRRSPEHRYPVQRDELLATVRWLRREMPAAGAPVLFGESAGATLCLSAAMSLRDAGEPLPAGLVLFYSNAAGPKPGLRPQSKWVWQQYLGHAGESSEPGAVPLLDSLKGLPPVWLAAGEDDPLMADTLATAERLTAAGNPPTLVRYPALPHAFVMWTGSLAPALAALEDAAAAARQFLGITTQN